MLNMRFNGKNICNPLDGQMDSLIETFIAVHGEDKRAHITERLENTTFLFLPRTFDDIQGLRETVYNERKQLSTEFFENLGCTIFAGKMTVDEFFVLKDKFESGDFDENIIKKLEQICEALFVDKSLRNYRNSSQFNRRDFDLIESPAGREFIECEEVNEALRRLFTLAERINEDDGCCEKDRKWLAEYSKIAKAFEKIADNDNKVKEKYANKISRLLEAKVASLLGKSIEEFEDQYDIQKQGSMIYAYRSLITRGRNKFADGLTLTNDVKRRYFELFLEMGVRCGSAELEDYAENKQLMDSIFDNRVIEAKEKLESQCENERANKNPFFIDAVKEIKGQDVKGGDMNLIFQVYQYLMHNRSVGAMVMHYMTNDNQLKTMCLLPLSTHLDRDTILHECEHIVESSIMMKGGDVWIKCGFETCLFQEDEESFDGTNLRISDDGKMMGDAPPRDLELLNETITQMFAYLASEESQRNGFSVGSVEHTNTWHMRMVRLFNPLYEFTEELSDVRISNDKALLEKKFGKVNVMIMDEVAKEYYALLKHVIPYNMFVTSIKEATGRGIEDIDFLNLPRDVNLGGSNSEFINQHILLAKVVKNIREQLSSGDKKQKKVENEFS